MYYNVTVKIPVVAGKIITRKKGTSTYILYQYGQQYKPEKKYAIPQRAIIGKMNPNNTSEMFPNERFEEFFPQSTVPEELPEAYRSCVLKIGTHAVISNVLKEYKLPELLHKRFGKDAGLLMDLVSYLIITEENAGQHYPNFAYDHPLFSDGMHIYSDSKVSRFFKSVTNDQIIGFLDDWNRKRNKKQRVYISYDSTNKSCQAGDISILEYGKSKVDMGFPIFNLGMAFDMTNRLPLFYETYGGSINDISQFRFMIDKAISYGYRDVGFILDRGYFCKDNIQYMDANGFAFIIMIKGKKELVRHLIQKNKGTFETDRDCCIRPYRQYGKTVQARLYEDDDRDRWFHMYFNPYRQAAEREQLETKIDHLKAYMDKHIGQDVNLGKPYETYFELHYSKNHLLTGYTERKDVIEEELNLCGYFCIVTSEEMTAEHALIHYKGRDISEKLFSGDKSFLGSRSMRVQTSAALSAKLFVEFIALIVRNRMYNLLKETMLRLQKKPDYMTVPSAIDELEKIEMCRRDNGRYKLDHAVSKAQKIILSSFGMSESSITSIAIEIRNRLENAKALPAEINDDAEVEDDAENALDSFC